MTQTHRAGDDAPAAESEFQMRQNVLARTHAYTQCRMYVGTLQGTNTCVQLSSEPRSIRARRAITINQNFTLAALQRARDTRISWN